MPPSCPTPAGRYRRPGFRPAALAALLGLAACDEGPATVTPYMHANGTLEFLASATRGEGPLYLEINGTPFADGDTLDARVVAVMEQALQSRVLRLTTDREAAEDPEFRLVLVFNPPNSGELLAFCRRQPAGGPPQPEPRIDLRAGCCRGDDLLAAVDGWVEEADGPEDERFDQLMHQVIRDIFTRRRRDE
ncbi:MAG: hypothetical protein ACFB13_13325 [Kiloniellaceae bacterium]